MKTFIRQSLTALALGLTIPSAALAQERPNTILVLDASGSMWGQIEGVNKITIAREVVADILSDFPADQNLGFVTYGHRERGSCTDIQTVIAPAPGTAPEIVKIVDELNPRGMTPMTDAVIAAAQALRSTEQAATVILVSDGIETCNPDPCAAARALEQAGVDFTTHVIGFDVKGEAEALMQMQCIASETGGRFLTADNAEELTAALEQVVAPTTGSFTFTANLATTDLGPEPFWDWTMTPPDAPLVPGNILWEINDAQGDRFATGKTNPFTVDMPFGDYTVTVHSEAHDMFSQDVGTYAPDSIHKIHVMFPEAEPELAELTLRAVMDSATGPLVETPVTWIIGTGADAFEIDGNPGVIELRPGEWNVTGWHTALELEKSIEITLAPGQSALQPVIFTTPEPSPPPATVSAPAQVVVGSAFAVTWEADGLHPRDYVTIVPAGAKAGEYGNTRRTEGKPEGQLRAPGEPGLYEVRLQLDKGGRVLASTPVEVVEADVSVSAPAQVVVGSSFAVSWQVEGLHPRDYITIVPVGAKEGEYGSTNRLEGKPEGQLRAPAEPGLYEVRLQLESSGRVLARAPVEVVEGQVTVSGPDKLRAGDAITVAVTGAIHPRDYVTMVPADAPDGDYSAVRRIEGKAEVTLTAPEAPGLYELRYQLESSNRVMARQAIEVLAADAPMDDGAGLVVPPAAKPGATITVTWTGGNDSADQRVALARADQADFSWISAETAIGRNRLDITMPDVPGRYEVRFLDIPGQTVLGRAFIEVAP